jgi:hypothetical protein
MFSFEQVNECVRLKRLSGEWDDSEVLGVLELLHAAQDGPSVAGRLQALQELRRVTATNHPILAAA